MSFYDVSYYAMITALLLLACVFLVLPLPKGKGLKTFSISLKLLSLSYALLGIFCIVKVNLLIDIIGIPFFVNAITQAHLLGNSHIIMVNPKAATLKRLLILLSPAFVLAIVSVILVGLYGYDKLLNFDDVLRCMTSFEKPDVFVRGLWLTYYLLICAHYIACFYWEARNAKNRIEDFTSEAHFEGLRYIHASFAIVVGIVVLSLFQTFCYNAEWRATTNFALLISYVCLGLFYVQYPKNFLLLQKSGINEVNTMETIHQDTSGSQESWPVWKSKIVNEELYTQVGITIVQLAQQLNTNRTTLSVAINKNEDANFNTFINKLRIDKAKKLMTEQAELTIADICLQVGYTDPSNFTRSFKSIIGCTPFAWRKNRN